MFFDWTPQAQVSSLELGAWQLSLVVLAPNDELGMLELLSVRVVTINR